MDKKKKIGIVTFHNAHNYGAMLQVYALQTILSKKHDVKIINYINPGIAMTYKPFRINKKNIFTRLKSLIAGTIYYRRDKKRYNIFNKFLKENLYLTDEYPTEEKLKLDPPKLDIYITGSDQVWNYDIAAKIIDVYTLNFGEKDVKRISYAASMGSTELNKNHIEQYIDGIKNIDHISVREENAKTYLEKLVNQDIAVTLDPTLLLPKNDWINLTSVVPSEKEKYIFAYILEDDDVFYRILNYISNITGYKVIHANRRNIKIDNILRSSYTDGPIEFVKLIQNAEFVIATSFHATVFSIIFHKKFWIIPPKKTESRITSLLKKLNIEERAVKSFEEFSDKDYNKPIDFESVDNILNSERNKSIDWLEKSIDD